MRNYEVTFIVDPVLSGDEIKATAQTYLDMLGNEGCTIVHTDEMGLRQLAYPINKRSSGIYFCVEFQTGDPKIIDKLELALRRDERIMRFLTIALDKFGVKYNADKREGKIGASKKRVKPITTLEPVEAIAEEVVKVAEPIVAAESSEPENE
jgi:small subunit ribosomal protein S6